MSTYLKQASQQLKNHRMLTFSALMIALCVALSYVPAIPIGDGVRVTWGFLARAMCGMVCGPVMAMVFGFSEDTISFVINPQGAYFPGYALTTMLGTMIYALFLYRQKPSIWRIFLAKASTNVLNVVLGSLWSAVLYSKGYLYYMSVSAFKNVVMLPVQTLLLVLLIRAIYPVLQRLELVPRGEGVLS